MFGIICLFAAEFEEPKIGISGKRVNKKRMTDIKHLVNKLNVAGSIPGFGKPSYQ